MRATLQITSKVGELRIPVVSSQGYVGHAKEVLHVSRLNYIQLCINYRFILVLLLAVRETKGSPASPAGMAHTEVCGFLNGFELVYLLLSQVDNGFVS